MLTVLLVVAVVSEGAFVAYLSSKGVAWDGMLCAHFGHGTPFQPAGKRHFECPRCHMAVGWLGTTSRSIPDAKREIRRVGENWRTR